MRSTLIFFERGASRFAAVALVATTALVAACDDNRAADPVAPAAVPTTPSDARYISTGVLVWKVVESGSQKLLGGAKFEIDGGPNNIQWVMTDNSAGDIDLVSGQFRFAGLAPGSYNVCEITPPAGHALAATNCKPGIVTAAVVTDVGVFVNEHLPWVGQGYVDYAKNFIGGGTFTVKDSLGTTIMSILDNSVLDVDKTDGKFLFQLPSAGRFTICETAAPPGWFFPNPQANLCVTRTFALSTGGNYGNYMVTPPYSAAWAVISGFLAPNNQPAWIGPSTFQVTKTDGSFSTTIVDNGPSDRHAMLGIFYVLLPSAGDYTVCEVSGVPGYYKPTPACHTLTAAFGLVATTSYFINPQQ